MSAPAGCHLIGRTDEMSGDGSAELLEDGSIKITFTHQNGGEPILRAKRDTSSTAC